MAEVNRRLFLMSSALAAQTAFSQEGPRIATGIIGTGNRGSEDMRAVLAQPVARVAAVCDIKPDRVDAAATVAARDNPATYSDYRKLLDRADIEAVVIATPPYLHAEMAIAALKAGKHVYCEKPIGITPESVANLVKAARKSDRVFQVGQQLRSFRQIGEAVARIHKGALGDLLAVRAQRHSSRDLSHEGSSADWYFDVDKSGGYLIEMSVHNLDLCNWALNAYPARAAGFGGTMLYKNDPPGRTIMDGYNLTYEYPGGLTMSYSQLVYHPRNLPHGGQSILLFGSKGATDLFDASQFYPAGEAPAEPESFVPKVEESRYGHMQAFYDGITRGTANPAPIEVGASGALTAILGHQAMVTGKVVEWKQLGVEL